MKVENISQSISLKVYVWGWAGMTQQLDQQLDSLPIALRGQV